MTALSTLAISELRQQRMSWCYGPVACPSAMRELKEKTQLTCCMAGRLVRQNQKKGTRGLVQHIDMRTQFDCLPTASPDREAASRCFERVAQVVYYHCLLRAEHGEVAVALRPRCCDQHVM
jgi:hypothetical protein